MSVRVGEASGVEVADAVEGEALDALDVVSAVLPWSRPAELEEAEGALAWMRPMLLWMRRGMTRSKCLRNVRSRATGASRRCMWSAIQSNGLWSSSSSLSVAC